VFYTPFGLSAEEDIILLDASKTKMSLYSAIKTTSLIDGGSIQKVF